LSRFIVSRNYNKAVICDNGALDCIADKQTAHHDGQTKIKKSLKTKTVTIIKKR